MKKFYNNYIVFFPFQIVSRFDFYKFIYMIVHLDIMCVYV
jgi:hypothetical protein